MGAAEADDATEATVPQGATGPVGTAYPLNAQTGTTYTLVLGDTGKFITPTNASTVSVTVPTNAAVAFPVGTRIMLLRWV